MNHEIISSKYHNAQLLNNDKNLKKQIVELTNHIMTFHTYPPKMINIPMIVRSFIQFITFNRPCFVNRPILCPVLAANKKFLCKELFGGYCFSINGTIFNIPPIALSQFVWRLLLAMIYLE